MAMQGGLAGEHSYARNSNVQASLFQSSSSVIGEAILENPGVFAGAGLMRIADIACSSGPNTLTSVDFVVKQIKELRHQQGQDTDECVFQVFSSDHSREPVLLLGRARVIHHEFVPKIVHSLQHVKLRATHSFQGWDLLSLKFNHLPYSQSVYNPGKVLVDSNSNPSAIAGYAAQAHEDLCSFLKHRAEELIPGGILSCFFLGKMTPDEKIAPWFNYFEEAWHQLVSEGVITQECLDNFNIRFYNRTLVGVQKVLEEVDCFKTIRLEQSPVKPPDPKGKGYLVMMSRGFKAVTRKFVLDHFKGDVDLTELLYQKTEQKIVAGSLIGGFQAENHITVIKLVLLRV